MDFDKWYFEKGQHMLDTPALMAETAWNHQQQRIAELEAAIKDALLCDNYVQITEVLQQALLPGGDE